MATIRAGGREVLTDTNPYGSRTLVVESDGISSVAYLCDRAGGVRGAVWLANHGPAPQTSDRARLSAGLPPVMPRAHTRHPSGRPPLDADGLSVLWFEEGDGVALFENDQILAVIPGWADMERGMPGYAREAIGETAFAWSLREAWEGLALRIAKARSYWRWRRGEGNWDSYRRLVLGHLDGRLGPAGRYLEFGGDRLPRVGVSERPAVPGRGHPVLSTVGMSCQRMPTVERYIEQPESHARIELATATARDPQAGARLLRWLAHYPWQEVTWLGHGHTARWRHRSSPFPLGDRYGGVIPLSGAGPGPRLPDLSGLVFGGDTVRWLWMIPLTEQELQLAHERGPDALDLSDRLPA